MTSFLIVLGILVLFSFIIAVRAKAREERATFALDPEIAKQADQAYLLRHKTDAEGRAEQEDQALKQSPESEG